MSEGKENRFYSRQIEMAIIGGCCDAPLEVVPSMVVHGVTGEWFHDPQCRGAHDTVREMFASGKSIDMLTLEIEMGSRPEAKVDQLFLCDCIDALVTPAYVPSYIEQLRNFFVKREIYRTAASIVADVGECREPMNMLLEIPERFSRILSVESGEKSNAELISHSIEVWEKARDDRKAGKDVVLAGMSTGIKGLDELLCGLQPGLIIVGGRPSEGKTTLGDQIMQHVATRYGAVALATLDMTRERMLRRAICREAGVSLPKLAKGFATERQLQLCRDVGVIVGKRPLYITDRLRNINSICSWGRVQKMRHDIKLLMVDHATLVGGNDDTADWNKRAVVEQVSSSLKALSIDLEIPVILVSQLNRQNKRDNRAPELEDLRESGALEQDANVVIFVYKDSDLTRNTKNVRAEWIEVKKYQDGETGKIPAWLHAPYFMFEEAVIGADNEGNELPFAMAPADYESKDEEDVSSGRFLAGLKMSDAQIQKELELQ